MSFTERGAEAEAEAKDRRMYEHEKHHRYLLYGCGVLDGDAFNRAQEFAHGCHQHSRVAVETCLSVQEALEAQAAELSTQLPLQAAGLWTQFSLHAKELWTQAALWRQWSPFGEKPTSFDDLPFQLKIKVLEFALEMDSGKIKHIRCQVKDCLRFSKLDIHYVNDESLRWMLALSTVSKDVMSACETLEPKFELCNPVRGSSCDAHHDDAHHERCECKTYRIINADIAGLVKRFPNTVWLSLLYYDHKTLTIIGTLGNLTYLKLQGEVDPPLTVKGLAQLASCEKLKYVHLMGNLHLCGYKCDGWDKLELPLETLKLESTQIDVKDLLRFKHLKRLWLVQSDVMDGDTVLGQKFYRILAENILSLEEIAVGFELSHDNGMSERTAKLLVRHGIRFSDNLEYRCLDTDDELHWLKDKKDYLSYIKDYLPDRPDSD